MLTYDNGDWVVFSGDPVMRHYPFSTASMADALRDVDELPSIFDAAAAGAEMDALGAHTLDPYETANQAWEHAFYELSSVYPGDQDWALVRVAYVTTYKLARSRQANRRRGAK